MFKSRRALIGAIGAGVAVAAAVTVGVMFVKSEDAPADASNKQLSIGMSQEFENLNPLIAQMMASRYMYFTVARPLLALDEKWGWQCWLCTRVPSIENGDAKIVTEGGKKKITVVWEIVPGAKWGDGTPVTANDFKLTWEIGRSPNVAVGDKDLFQKIETFTIDPKNNRRFTLKFNEARYDFYQLTGLYSLPSHLEGPVWEKAKSQAGAYEKQTVYNTNPTNPGLYNGPYLVKEVKLGSHVIMEPNPHFYGTKPAVERLIFKLIQDTATLEANLLSGTIDMISEMGFTFDQALAFEKRLNKDRSLGDRFAINFREGMTYEHIDINFRNPILQDKRVRQALLFAIDRNRLTTALFEGKQRPALHNIHPADPYFSDAVTKYEPDVARANALLEEAGWKMGAGGIRAKDGKPLSFTLMTTAQNKTRENVQVFLQSEWKKVGIDLKIKNEPARVFFGETVRKGLYPDLAMFAWVSAPDSPPRTTLHSEAIPTEKNGHSGQNSGAWNNKRVDEVLDAVLKEFNFDKRKALMAELQKIYTEEVPVLPLYLRTDIAVTPKKMTGFALTGHQFPSTLKVEQWNVAPRVAGK